MTRCEKCQYALIRDRCPMCAVRQVKGVGQVVKAEATPKPINNIAESLRLYWSPAP